MAELSLQEIPNKTSGIYKLTNPNGSVYIGQSWNIKNRIKTYRSLDCKKQPKLYNSLIKYGFDSHKVEILCELPFDLSQDVMNEFERTYWLFFNECNFNMLNLKEPGSNGKYSEESRKKMGKHRIGVAPWNKGLKNPYSEETIKSMSESSKTENPPSQRGYAQTPVATEPAQVTTPRPRSPREPKRPKTASLTSLQLGLELKHGGTGWNAFVEHSVNHGGDG